MRKGRIRQVEVDTGSRSPNPACRRLRRMGRLISTQRWQHQPAAHWATKQPSPGTSMLAPQGEGPRKGGLNKACLHMSQLSHRGRRVTSNCGRNISKENRCIPHALKRGNRLKLACWNVRTMLDSSNNTRPERRSALIAHELPKLNIDIAALGEIRLSEEGCLRERGAGYTLYWSGKSPEERRFSGVGIMVRDSIATKLTDLPISHSDRIFSMRLPLSVQQHACLFSVHPQHTRQILQENTNLHRLTQPSSKHSNKWQECHPWRFQCQSRQRLRNLERCTWKTSLWKLQWQWRTLPELRAQQQLCITNTVFQQKDRLKTTSLLAHDRLYPCAPTCPERCTSQ